MLYEIRDENSLKNHLFLKVLVALTDPTSLGTYCQGVNYLAAVFLQVFFLSNYGYPENTANQSEFSE